MSPDSPNRPDSASRATSAGASAPPAKSRSARLLIASVLAAATIAAAVWSLSGRFPKGTKPSSDKPVVDNVLRPRQEVDVPLMPFVEVTDSAGIRFVHDNGAAGDKLLPETMGGGVAFFDYDGDGDPDILFVNSQPWLGDDRPVENPARMALYRNDGHGQFEDVTEGSGLDVSFYGMGVACGDYDNDGRIDLFLSAVGPGRLFRNVGGRFEDVTAAARIAEPADAWSTACGWFDYDNDGRLDLLVCHYLAWTRELDSGWNFTARKGMKAYGRPQNFDGVFPSLYRNKGDGTFEEVSEAAGLRVRDSRTGQPVAKSLGLTFADVDADGRLDILIANDTTPNQLFRNRGDGTFEEIGTVAGIAHDSEGHVRGAMGIDAARFRNDRSMGVAIGNFSDEGTALYVSPEGSPQFSDVAVRNGLFEKTRHDLTFGVLFADLDLDSRLDLLTANGHLEVDIHLIRPGYQYAQPPRLFWNCGRGQKSELVTIPIEKCGLELARPIVARGLASADIDGDGDLDLLMTASGGKPRLARNDQQLGNHWLKVRLIGTASNRDAIGAVVEAELPDGTVLSRMVMPTRSYLSQCELPVALGLGTATAVETLRVKWPSGRVSTLLNEAADRVVTVTEPAK